jgi:uncharacterized membrane protein (UPF0127 family)
MTGRPSASGLLWWAALLPAVAALGCGEDPAPAPPQVEISGHRWFVDVATTQAQRYRGLSGRENLREGTGMLFVYPAAKVREFCMRGCLVPLDIAFLDADLRVVSMRTMAVEPDLAGQTTYSSGEPAQYALEVPAGELSAAGVSLGDRATLLGAIPSAAKAEPGP